MGAAPPVAAAADTHSDKLRIVASYLASGWSALISLAFLPLYIRYMGIESYGLIGFFATMQVWLSIFDLGLATTLNRESARFLAGACVTQSIRDLLKSIELVYAAIAIGLAIIVIGLSPLIATKWLIAKDLSTETVTQSVVLMGLLIAVQWMGTLYRGGLLGMQRQIWLSGATSLTATAKAVGTVLVLMFVSPTVTAFFLFQCAASGLETIVLGLRLHRVLPRAPSVPRFNAASLRSIWRFAGGLTTLAIFATALTQVDKILIAKMLPLDQFGYFMLMATIAGALSILVVPIQNVAFPRFGELASARNEHAFAMEYHKFAQLLSIGVIPVSLLLMFFPDGIVFLWTGDAVISRAVAQPLRIWVLGTVLNSLTHVPHMAQMAHGWTRLSIAVNTVSVASTIALLLVLVPRHGIIAAAWIWVGVNVFYLLVAIPLMHRRILNGEMLRWCFSDVLLPAATGALTMLIAVLLFPQEFAAPSLAVLVISAVTVLLTVTIATKTGRSALRALGRDLVRSLSGIAA